jgi:hypothetical protein
MGVTDLKHGDALLVIVGAGASSDPLPTDIWLEAARRPPLTKDLARGSPLGNTLATRYPNAQPLLDALRTSLAVPHRSTAASAEATTLEAALSEYLDRQSYDPNVRRHIAAMRFYLRDLLWDTATEVLNTNGGITNYTRLVTRCFQWAAKVNSHVCFVSFNYDHLLESACRAHFDLKVDVLPSYLGDPYASVLKPHGSVLWNWIHPEFTDRIVPGSSADLAISAGEPEAVESREVFASTSPSNEAHGPNGPRVALPALALPITDKSQLVWPSDQDHFFRNQIPNGSFGRVAIIGWRAAESHFTKLLDRLIPPGSKCLIVAGGDKKAAIRDAEETAANLGDLRHRVQERVVPEGFHLIGDESWNWLLS